MFHDHVAFFNLLILCGGQSGDFFYVHTCFPVRHYFRGFMAESTLIPKHFAYIHICVQCVNNVRPWSEWPKRFRVTSSETEWPCRNPNEWPVSDLCFLIMFTAYSLFFFLHASFGVASTCLYVFSLSLRQEHRKHGPATFTLSFLVNRLARRHTLHSWKHVFAANGRCQPK